MLNALTVGAARLLVGQTVGDGEKHAVVIPQILEEAFALARHRRRYHRHAANISADPAGRSSFCRESRSVRSLEVSAQA